MSLREAIRSWDMDVEAEAERLIKGGTPPYDAIERAKQIIIRRRSGTELEIVRKPSR
jgi:hypothetical protein